MAHRITAADVQEPWCQSRQAHLPEHALGVLDADAPVFRVAALGADVEGNARQVRPELHRFGNNAVDIGTLDAELARERPVAADVRRLDPDVELGVGLDAVNLAQLLDAVQHVPLHTLRGRIFEVGAGLHRVAVVDLGRRHAQAEQEVELGDGGDLEAHAFLDQGLQHARIGIRLHRVVRLHARHGGLEAAGLDTDDLGVDEEEGLGIALFQRFPDVAEVQAYFGVGIEKMLFVLESGLLFLEGDRAHDHQSLLYDLGFRNERSNHISRAAAVPQNCHDDLL